MLDDPTWINRQKNQEPPTDRAHNNGIALWHTKSHFTPISHKKKKKKKRKKTGNNLDWGTWRGESDLDGIMGLESGFFRGESSSVLIFRSASRVCGGKTCMWIGIGIGRGGGEVRWFIVARVPRGEFANFNQSTSKKNFLKTSYWRLINKSIKMCTHCSTRVVRYKTFSCWIPLSPLFDVSSAREKLIGVREVKRMADRSDQLGRGRRRFPVLFCLAPGGEVILLFYFSKISFFSWETPLSRKFHYYIMGVLFSPPRKTRFWVRNLYFTVTRSLPPSFLICR